MPTDNEIEDQDEDWLPHCVPFSGIEADQPTGILGLPAGIFAEDLVKEVIIFDDNTEDGLRTVKKTEITPDMKIANLKFWEARIASLIEASGIWVVDVDGKKMSRKEWFDSISPITGEPRHTDALAIWAMRKLYRGQTGGGVHVQKKPGPFGVHATKPEGAGTVTTDLGTGKNIVHIGGAR